MSKKILQRDSSTGNILKAAMALFSEQGYDSTSIRQIAAKAGISLGLLYNYFKSKEEVLKACLQNGRKEFAETIQPLADLTPVQQLDFHIRATFKSLEVNKEFWRLYYSLRLQNQVAKAMEQEMQPENLKVLNHLSACLANAGSTSPSAEAKLLVATLDGIAQHYLLSPEFPIQDVMIRLLVQLKTYLAAS